MTKEERGKVDGGIRKEEGERGRLRGRNGK
jgi:hypothetical protein